MHHFSIKKPCYMKEILGHSPVFGMSKKTVRGESTALIVCETSPPDGASSCSLCKAGPSTEEPRVAEGCGVGRTCTRGHNSKDSWRRSCRHLRNGTDAWRSTWGCDMSWRCFRTAGWTSSSSSPCNIKGWSLLWILHATWHIEIPNKLRTC